MKIITFFTYHPTSNYRKLADCSRKYHIILFRHNQNQNQNVEKFVNNWGGFKYNVTRYLLRRESTLIWLWENYFLILNSWVFEKEFFPSFFSFSNPYAILNTLIESFTETPARTIPTQNSFCTKLNFFFFSYLEGFDDETSIILYNTNANFHKNYTFYEKQIVSKLDHDIFNKMTARVGFFTPYAEYFEISEWYPLEANKAYEDRAMINFSWDKFFDLWNNIDAYEKTMSYYIEPYFFFWDRIEQPLEDFWFICFFREWAILLDDWIYSPKKKNNLKFDFPPLSHLAGKAEFKPGFQNLKWLFDYKNNQPFSYYLSIHDMQELMIDKNFLPFWNYWDGVYKPMNYFGPRGWTGILNYFWEKIYTPRVHAASKFFRSDYGYGSYSTRMLEFAFFPDIVSYWGRYNPTYDWLTSGFNRFFHFGDTFMDTLNSLELLRYQLTEVYWGGFESFVADFSAYQPTYFSDAIATIWTPMIMLLARTSYTTPGNMNMFITDYNKVFKFKSKKMYKDFSAEIFYDLPWLDRLALVWDVTPVDQWSFILEKELNLFFAYNSSTSFANSPSWLVPITSIDEFYSSRRYDYSEDRALEQFQRKMVTSLTLYDYKHNSWPSIYFTKNFQTLADLYKYWFRFFNEKVFDDSGFFASSLHRGQKPTQMETFSWLQNFPIFHLEYLPRGHYSWNIKIFNHLVLDWNFISERVVQSNWIPFTEALDETFFLGIKQTPYPYAFLGTNGVIFTSEWIARDTVYFTVDPYPLLRFFKILYGPSKLDFYFNKIFEYYWVITNKLPEPYYFMEVTTFFNYLNKIYLFIDRYLILHTLLTNIIYSKDFILNLNLVPINFLAEIIILIVKNFTYTRLPLLQTQLVVGWKWIYDIAAVGLVDNTLYPLPIEFFIPGLKLWKHIICPSQIFEDHSLVTIIPFLPNGKQVSVWNIDQLWDWISLGGMVSIVTEFDRIHLTKEQMDSLNTIDCSSYKIHWLEYDWYLNYVVKYRCYKRH